MKSVMVHWLKKLSNGEDIESVVDIQQVIRYFVVHNYVCNGDSYTGSMIHNYYLYEEDGQMAMIPWDYNLAYGTFQGGNGQSTVNTPIDAPVSGDAGEDRPMWSWILSDESYTQMYHQYFAEFLNTVDIQGIIDNAYNLIKSYVGKDPTAFFTYEEFEAGVETMRRFCELRSESISLQLENGETTENMSYVDASGLTLSDMGSMSGMGGMGGGRDFGGGNMPETGDKGGFGGRGSSERGEANEDESANSGFESIPQTGDVSANGLSSQGSFIPNVSAGAQSSTAPQMPGDFSGGMPDGFGGKIPEGFTGGMSGGFNGEIPEGFTGEMPNMGDLPEGFDPSQIPGGFTGGIPDVSSGATETNSVDETTTPEETTTPDDSENVSPSQNSSRPSRGNMQMPDGDFNFGTGGAGMISQSSSGWIWIAVSFVILGVGLIVAKMYKY